MTLEDKITLIYFLGWSSTEKRMRDALNARYRRFKKMESRYWYPVEVR